MSKFTLPSSTARQRMTERDKFADALAWEMLPDSISAEHIAEFMHAMLHDCKLCTLPRLVAWLEVTNHES